MRLWIMLDLPFFAQLADRRSVLVAGAGGGFAMASTS
jgi:hypothetical protein